eukprot:NODE_485_length_7794_cov_0.605848.p2 type:complete len:386 gc:universal NODE_485_length_7794_cov_0.605848:368-1525(+)
MCFCIKSVKKKCVVLDQPDLPEPYHSKYELGQILGNGGFGKVFSGTSKTSKTAIVLKVLHRKDSDLPKEVQILQNLPNHHNVIKYLDHFYNNSWNIVLERFGYLWNNTSCDLFEMIEHYNHSRKDRIAINENSPDSLCMCEETVRIIMTQVVNAVEFLSYQNIIHRDIKDENILVDFNLHIKLADFGSATLINSNVNKSKDEAELNRFGGVFNQFMGTIQYASPEVVRYHGYCGFMQEVWSLGILMFTLLFGYSPFKNKGEILFREIKFNSVKPHLAKSISNDCKSLLLGCLSRNMLERYTLNDIMDSKWLDYTPQQFVEPSVSWDMETNTLYNLYSLDRYRSWSLVRKIGEPFEVLYSTVPKRDKISSFASKITRKDTKIGLSK